MNDKTNWDQSRKETTCPRQSVLLPSNLYSTLSIFSIGVLTHPRTKVLVTIPAWSLKKFTPFFVL